MEISFSSEIQELRKEAIRQLEYYNQNKISYSIERKVVKRWLEITDGDILIFDELAQFSSYAFYQKYVGSILFYSFCCEIRGLYLLHWKFYLCQKFRVEIGQIKLETN